jgi:flagellar basal-body rod protein FlgF
MESPTYVALSAQLALRKQLDVVANNVANANTTGFKPDRQLFQTFVERLAVPGGAVFYVQDRATYIDLAEGPVTLTGNPLDIAVKGDAFLAVSARDQTLYTRDGHMQVGPDGTLRNSSGHAFLGPDNQPIQLPANFSDIRITADGMITVTVDRIAQQVGQIGLFRVNDPLALRKQGDSLLSAPEGTVQPIEPDDPNGFVVQGGLEGSSVSAVREIANLTELSRAYDRLQTFFMQDNDRERKMIETLGQTG